MLGEGNLGRSILPNLQEERISLKISMIPDILTISDHYCNVIFLKVFLDFFRTFFVFVIGFSKILVLFLIK